MQLHMHIDGIEQMQRLLADLPNAAQQRVMRPSLRAAARVIATGTKAATPIGPTGNLKRGGGFIRQSRDPGPLGVAFRIGYKNRLGAHALLVDKGTGPRQTKAGAFRGRGPARRFFDAAVGAAFATALLGLRANMGARLAVEARRYAAGQLSARGTILPQFRRTGRR